MSNDRTPQLQQLMQQVGFSSFKALSQATGISEKQLRRLRQGDLAQIRLNSLLKLSQVLQVSITDLLNLFLESQAQFTSPDAQTTELDDLKREYDRLQAQLAQQKQELWQEFQQSSLQTLESLLLQLPTAAYAAQQNPEAPAVKLLPLLKPLDRLLETWGITAIARVGTEVPYDPQQHQLINGTAEPGNLVKVRYTGYCQGDKLLYRARVSPSGNS